MLTGPAKYLFIPLALSVVFSMLASYLLSRTLVPTMARLLMESEEGHGGGGAADEQRASDARTEHPKRRRGKAGLWKQFNAWRDRMLDRLREAYGRALSAVLDRPAFVLTCAGLLVAGAGFLTLVVGTDFFPDVDAGLMRIHFRAPAGTRIEDTEVIVAKVEERIRRMTGADFQTVTDTIGVPTSYNLGFVQTDSTGDQDADINVSLAPGHKATTEYMQQLRREIPAEFPGSMLYFEPASIIERVLDFGLSAPIDVQISGNESQANMALAQKMLGRIQRVAGVQDARIKQVFEHPAIDVRVDRQRAAYVGVTERDVANSLLTSLSSSIFVSPAFWLNPNNLVNYFVSVQTPIVNVRTPNDIIDTPLGAPSGALAAGGATSQSGPSSIAGGSTGGSSAPLSATTALQPATPATVSQASYVGAVASVVPGNDEALISHHNVQPVVDLQCNVVGRDLGGASGDIRQIVDEFKKERLPKGTMIAVNGQADSMKTSFRSLGLGLIIAVALVYLLLVVLFQSWLDPLIIVVAVPGALVGIMWMLVATGTTLNVESLMGSIMAVGIAVSNSILLVSFANDVQVEKKLGPKEAALEAGKTRLRPVMMTAIAMILGMFPMALSLGEGGEQNAPLGRAVIGGLVVATFVTLFVVPLVYSRLRTRPPRKHELDEQFASESAGHEGENEGARRNPPAEARAT